MMMSMFSCVLSILYLLFKIQIIYPFLYWIIYLIILTCKSSLYILDYDHPFIRSVICKYFSLFYFVTFILIHDFESARQALMLLSCISGSNTSHSVGLPFTFLMKVSLKYRSFRWNLSLFFFSFDIIFGGSIYLITFIISKMLIPIKCFTVLSML